MNPWISRRPKRFSATWPPTPTRAGKAFIVLPSTTSPGRSRIRARLTEGSVVTTLKNTVDHVATEWGVAHLRADRWPSAPGALIAIAHPDHREALEREARSAPVSLSL